MKKEEEKKDEKGRGQHSTMVIILASRPSCPGFNSPHSLIFFSEETIVDVAEVKQWRCLEEIGQ